ncbi:MAG TPA: peptidylprolyl isomerase [Chloroflexi bacterium]|nr:peptidylprolyl isomerase [Chloroflexota bacterium]HBY09558.1 peptidylprolyl isomerase [Chloroflexota bacterium]
MTESNELTLVADDVVVSMEYTLTVDGEIVDSSEEEGPIQFLQGYGNIIPGLEAHLGGLAVGESLQVTVAPKDGYGEFDSEQIVDVPLDEFPEEICVEPGVELEMRDEDGDLLYARILSVGKSRVKLDFNHPLAGKELTFDVTIVGLRHPTPEELEHGHVHGSEGHAH